MVHCAGFWRRGAATLIDSLLLVLVMLLILLILLAIYGAEYFEGGADIKAKRAFKIPGGGVCHRFGRETPGIIYHNVDTSEFGHAGIGQLLQLREIQHVGRYHQCSPPKGDDILGNLLQVGLGTRSKYDVGPGLGEGPGNASSYTLAGAGNHRYFIVQAKLVDDGHVLLRQIGFGWGTIEDAAAGQSLRGVCGILPSRWYVGWIVVGPCAMVARVAGAGNKMMMRVCALVACLVAAPLSAQTVELPLDDARILATRAVAAGEFAVAAELARKFFQISSI